MDRYFGQIVLSRVDGRVVVDRVVRGPMRVSGTLVATADPRWLERTGDLLVFRAYDPAGDLVELRYRIIGTEPGGETGDDGWFLTEPVPDAVART